MNRRKYLHHSATFAAGLMIQHLAVPLRFSDKKDSALIREVHLQTAVEIELLVSFYSDTLGFKTLKKNVNQCSFQIGQSILKFDRCNTDDQPHYHFAFNIAEKKIKSAASWMNSKSIEIISPPDHLTQVPEYNRDIVYFRHWDAHAIFFYDPAGNVVEFIARHTLPDEGEAAFSIKDVHFISEIAFVADDVPALSDEIANSCGIAPYSSQSAEFAALGSERGLVLCFKSGSSAVFGGGRERAVYSTNIHLHCERQQQLFKKGVFNIFGTR